MREALLIPVCTNLRSENTSLRVMYMHTYHSYIYHTCTCLDNEMAVHICTYMCMLNVQLYMFEIMTPLHMYTCTCIYMQGHNSIEDVFPDNYLMWNCVAVHSSPKMFCSAFQSQNVYKLCK